ncbi:MAG: Fic family protein [Acidobacteriota bacterium]
MAITRTSFRSRCPLGKPVQNHPFVDGNKRVAVTVTAAFLTVNGYRLRFDDTEAYKFLLGPCESGTLRFRELESAFATMCSSRRESLKTRFLGSHSFGENFLSPLVDGQSARLAKVCAFQLSPLVSLFGNLPA